MEKDLRMKCFLLKILSEQRAYMYISVTHRRLITHFQLSEVPMEIKKLFSCGVFEDGIGYILLRKLKKLSRMPILPLNMRDFRNYQF